MSQSLFIPENLNLHTVLASHHCASRFQKPHAIDKFHYLIDNLYLRKILQKNATWTDFFPVNARILEKVVTPQWATIVKDTLVRVGVLEQDSVSLYQVGVRSKSYRFANPYRATKFRAVPIRDRRLATRIRNLRFDQRASAVRDHQGRELIARSVERLTFDVARASEYLDSDFLGTEDQKAARKICVQMFADREFFFHVDEQGRVYHNLTSLPRDLRRFVTFEGQGLFAVDVGNCQPALLSRLYKTECAEKKRFVELVEKNRLYAYLNERLEQPFDLEDDERKATFKQLVFHKIFYGSNYGVEVAISHVFKREFPRLYELVRQAKAKHHRDLPVLLQKEEAIIVIDTVASAFAKRNSIDRTCLISLHDCLISTQEHVDELAFMLRNEFGKLLGFFPPVKATQLSHGTAGTSFELSRAA